MGREFLALMLKVVMVRTVVTPEDKMKTSVNGFFFEQTLKRQVQL